MKATEIRTVGGNELRALVSWQGEGFELFYRVEGESLPGGGDAILSGLLPLAMGADGVLEVEAAVSPQLLGSLDDIQAIYREWSPSARRVTVKAEERPTVTDKTGSALFFSGGVDSLYSLLKHQAEQPALVLVNGFDVPLTAEGTRLFAEVRQALQKAADRFGCRLVVVTTNLQELTLRFRDGGHWLANWSMVHGAALASVALALGYPKAYVGSTHSYDSLVPWGSHPLLDHLWSTEAVRVIHDGAEATRLDKVRRIARSREALGCLRVCFENPGGAYNCGRCSKCLRTMVALHIARSLDLAPTFPPRVDARQVRQIDASSPNDRAFFKELERATVGSVVREDRAILKALRVAMKPRKAPLWRRATRRVRRSLWPSR